jgi:DNA repair protein RadC
MALPAFQAPMAPHVARLRRQSQARLARDGASRQGDVELLAIATGCRLATAAAVLETLGGAAELSSASPLELAHAGLSPSRAAALAASCELARRALRVAADTTWHVRAPGDLAQRLLAEMSALEREELRVAVLNTKNAVLALVTVYVGSVAGSAVRVGEVFRDAVRRHGSAVIVVHNHPSGDPSPSPEDVRITAELVAAGRLLDIELLDHLVIGRDRWVSLRSIGRL